MRVSHEQVKRIAALSRLHIGRDELDGFAAHLDAILSHFEKLNELPTEGVAPTAHILPIRNAFREDEVLPSMARELLTQNAPEKEEGCFIVPKVVE